MISMLQNSVYGAGLTMEMSNAWLQQWNGFRSGVQSAQTQFLSWKTQTNAFLEDYKKNELATKLANSNQSLSSDEFNLLQKDPELNLAYKNADTETKQAIDNAKITVDQAKTALENAKKSKAAAQKQMEFSLQNAQIGVSQAQRNAAKLVVKAPINGTVVKVMGEVGQTISPGVVVAQFVGSQAQATIDMDPRVALFLEV